MSQTAPGPSDCSASLTRRLRAWLTAAKEAPFLSAVAAFVVLAAVAVLLPADSKWWRLYRLVCGFASAACIFFATGLWLAKQCPAGAPSVGFMARCRAAALFPLVWFKKKTNKLREWHNVVGALALPLAFVHASSLGRSYLTIALLWALAYVVLSGFAAARLHFLNVLKKSAETPLPNARIEKCAECADDVLKPAMVAVLAELAKTLKPSPRTLEAAVWLDPALQVALKLHQVGTIALWILLLAHVVIAAAF